jgi:hypothetical protein
MKKAIQLFGLLLIIGFMIMPDASAQCTMCKSNLEMARQDGGTNVGNTINDGILYLLALPYLIAGAFAFIYYKKYKEKKNSLSTTT